MLTKMYSKDKEIPIAFDYSAQFYLPVNALYSTCDLPSVGTNNETT
jgi:hypothetical protein